MGAHGLPGELPERHHDHGVTQQQQLAGEIRRGTASRSAGVGLLAGGAQCTVAVM